MCHPVVSRPDWSGTEMSFIERAHGTMTDGLKTMLDYVNPPKSIGTVGSLGELTLRSVSMGSMGVFQDLPDSHAIAASGVVDHLIVALVERSDGAKFSENEVEALVADDRAEIVSHLIKHHSNWFDGADATVREPGEADEEYLARGFRATSARFKASQKRLKESLLRSTTGMSERLKAAMLPGLTANSVASDHLGGIINSISRGSAIVSRADGMGGILGSETSKTRAPPSARITHEPFTTPDVVIAPHPAHETNALLEGVSQRIEDMRALAVGTAELQRSLNETATAAVSQFSKGAEAAERAAADGLALSRNSLALSKDGLSVAIASAVLSAIAIIASVVMWADQNGKETAREEAAAAQAGRLVAIESRLAAAMEANVKLAKEGDAAARLSRKTAASDRLHTGSRQRSRR